MPENPPRSDVEEQVLEDQKLVGERKDHVGKALREHHDEPEEPGRARVEGPPEREAVGDRPPPRRARDEDTEPSPSDVAP